VSTSKELNEPVNRFTLLVWADLYKDMAETFFVWTKIDRAYHRAHEKMQQCQDLAGGSFLLHLLIWAEICRRHANAADKYGHHEEAAELRRRAGECLPRAQHLLYPAPIAKDDLISIAYLEEKASEMEATKLQLAVLFKQVD